MEISFIEQEREARAYNKAFLHGKEYGLSTGRNIAIDQVLEIIDELCTDEDNGKMIAGRMVYILASEFRNRVLALKGGEQE